MKEMNSKGSILSLYIPRITCSNPCGDGDIVGFSPQFNPWSMSFVRLE